MPTTASARDDRAAVDKAVSLLMSFGQQGSTGLGVTELARRADLSKSTAYRVLEMLRRNGVVERAGSGYRLGLRLHDLGRSVYAPGHEELRDLLIPQVAELYEVTHEMVHLAALHGTEVVYLAKLYGHRQVRSPSRIGGRAPAYCTAVGKALLAYDLGCAIDQLSGPLRRYTPHTLADTDALRVELTRVTLEGVAFDRQEIQTGLECVAAPIIGPDGRAVAALSVSGPAARVDLLRHAHTLRRVASSASGALARQFRSTSRAPHRVPALQTV